MSLAEIAAAQGMTVSEVREIIDQEAARCFAGEELRRTWLLEARRLRELGQKYYDKAMSDAENAANSAIIFIKASERLATLTGMNAPQGHSVTLIHEAARPERQTGTDKIRAAIDRIRGRQIEAQQDKPITPH